MSFKRGGQEGLNEEQDDSPTELDVSRLSETKIVKRERKRSNKKDAPESDVNDLEMWEWIDRDVDDNFFKTAGKNFDRYEATRRFNEIPEYLKPLAYVIITLAIENKKRMTGKEGPCMFFRCELFMVHKDLQEKGIDLHLPYAWFCDGVMIEPEWIVRITNGLVGWSCNPDYDNPDTCGLEDCRYRRFDPSITASPVAEPCLHPKDKIVFVNGDVATLLLLDEGFYCKDCKKRVELPDEEPDKMKWTDADEPRWVCNNCSGGPCFFGGEWPHVCACDGESKCKWVQLKPPAEEPKLVGDPEEIEKDNLMGALCREITAGEPTCRVCGGRGEEGNPILPTRLGKYCKRCWLKKPARKPEKGEKQLHAGLEYGGLNLIVFDDTEWLRKMLNVIGFPVDDKGIVTNKGEPVTCSGCGCKLTLDDIGHVMPPDHFYCSSPVCIMDYYERYGYPEGKVD